MFLAAAVLGAGCGGTPPEDARADSGAERADPAPIEATEATEADGASDAGDGSAGSPPRTFATTVPAGTPDPGFAYDGVDYGAPPVDSGLRGNRANLAFPPPLVDPASIRSGGPPPDGIPAIDAPRFIGTGEVDFLADDEAVILVEIDGVAKAYPIQILIWHEIVNDTFGDVPVTVTYCPLCNSALAFDRRLGGRVLDFGTSGELYQSALVMYDRQTESLWAHFTGRGLLGHHAGARLESIAAQTVSWEQFRSAHPDGSVLSRETGFERSYGLNPYPGYDDEDSEPFAGFFSGDIDRRLAAKARIVGVVDPQGVAAPVAVRLDDLVEVPAIPVTVGDRSLVVFHRPGLASALDAARVDGGRDVGQTGVFEAVAPDGSGLTFEVAAEAGQGATRFRDRETGSVWDVLGRAVDGPMAGARLTPVPHVDTFWFAWATYRPDTRIVEP